MLGCSSNLQQPSLENSNDRQMYIFGEKYTCDYLKSQSNRFRLVISNLYLTDDFKACFKSIDFPNNPSIEIRNSYIDDFNWLPSKTTHLYLYDSTIEKSTLILQIKFLEELGLYNSHFEEIRILPVINHLDRLNISDFIEQIGVFQHQNIADLVLSDIILSTNELRFPKVKLLHFADSIYIRSPNLILQSIHLDGSIINNANEFYSKIQAKKIGFVDTKVRGNVHNQVNYHVLELDFYNTFVEDLDHIGIFKNLIALGTGITIFPIEQISKLVNLEVLFLSIEQPSNLLKLSTLNQLQFLKVNSAIPIDFKYLPKLKELRLLQIPNSTYNLSELQSLYPKLKTYSGNK